MKRFFLSTALLFAITTASLAAPAPATVGDTSKVLSAADYRREIKTVTSALERAPRDGKLYRRRADAEIKLHDYQNAVADYTKAIQMKIAADADVFYNRGMAQLKLEEYRKAIADFNAAIKLRPTDAGALYARGVARIMALEYKPALADLNRSIALDSTQADSYEYRGIAYAMIDKKTEACRDLARAVKMNPEAEKSQRQYCKATKGGKDDKKDDQKGGKAGKEDPKKGDKAKSKK